MTDIEKTQHYSDNPHLIENLIDTIPKNQYYIEPFYGKGALNKYFNFSEYYDIDFPTSNIHYRDTLLNPPNYKNKWVITNPPYLAKNKAKDKKYFQNNRYDDLYKIAIDTIMDCEGGILIIPLNFFTDERSYDIRNKFLSKFNIKLLNIFTRDMFEKTAYNVCSFSFERADNTVQSVPIFIDNKDNIIMFLEKQYNYRLCGDFYDKIDIKNSLSRLTKNNKDKPSYINIICIDKTNEPLHFYNNQGDYFIGKETDRNQATICNLPKITIKQQNSLIQYTNKFIQQERQRYHNLLFTNFRDRGRKRVSFKEAYQILTYCYNQLYV